MADGLMTSQETFGNRINNQQMYQSYSQPSAFLTTNTGVAGPQHQQMTMNNAASPIDDEFDVDRE